MKLIKKGEGVELSGTSLVGYVTAVYADLVEKIGYPTYTGDKYEKVQAEWLFQFEDEDGNKFVASLYDWKNYESGVPQGVYEWHVGGNSTRAVEAVANLLGNVALASR